MTVIGINVVGEGTFFIVFGTQQYSWSSKPAIMMFMRIYVLYHTNRPILIGVGLVLLFQICMNAWLLTHGEGASILTTACMPYWLCPIQLLSIIQRLVSDVSRWLWPWPLSYANFDSLYHDFWSFNVGCANNTLEILTWLTHCVVACWHPPQLGCRCSTIPLCSFWSYSKHFPQYEIDIGASRLASLWPDCSKTVWFITRVYFFKPLAVDRTPSINFLFRAIFSVTLVLTLMIIFAQPGLKNITAQYVKFLSYSYLAID